MEIIRYPDNQISVKCGGLDINGKSKLKTRINSYEDLFYLKSICEVHEHHNQYIDELTIPCLFGQRSDRRFSENQSFDLKIICDFINSCGIKRVKIFDPHSDVSLALINNSEKISSFEFVEKTVKIVDDKNLVLISPDAGAYKKIFSYAEKLNLPLVAANKFRDLKGNITLSITGDVKDKDCLIVDDLLDGGYTFHLLAEKLKEIGANNVYLYISHAYFNKGFDFTPHIEHFYCTNSVKNINHSKVTQFKII